MDTLPLPPRPDLGHYRKRAKELVGAAKSGDEALAAWAGEWLELLRAPTAFVAESFARAIGSIEQGVRDKVRRGERVKLADAQFLIARAHGFTNWQARRASRRRIRRVRSRSRCRRRR